MGPFDLVPAPEDTASLVGRSQPEWRGAYTEDYAVPRNLIAATEKIQHLREKKPASVPHAHRAMSNEAHGSDIIFEDPVRQAKITKALAFLASRGKSISAKVGVLIADSQASTR